MSTISQLLLGAPVEEALELLRTRPSTCVGLVGSRRTMVRSEFVRLARDISESDVEVSVRIGAGSERIDWPNGSRLLVVSNPRGYRFDAVVLVGATYTYLPRSEWAPALVTSCLLTVEPA